jgi:hypothetical protein
MGWSPGERRMSDGLSLSATTADAEARRARYRLVVALVLGADCLMGLALLIWPATVTGLIMDGDPGRTEWARFAGLLVLVVAAFTWTGRNHPNRAKLVNVVAIASRVVLGLALVAMGGRLLWIGLFDLVSAAVMARFYYRFFAALVMSRP